MTDTQATPRPWRAEGRDAIVDTRDEPVAHVYPHKYGGHWTLEEMEAHRALIVKAVNAHEGLIKALRRVDTAGIHVGPCRVQFAREIEDCTCQVAIVRAALAAAEGKGE